MKIKAFEFNRGRQGEPVLEIVKYKYRLSLHYLGQRVLG